MKVAIVGSKPVPYVFGGMDRFYQGLYESISKHHDTDLILLPVDESTWEGVLKGYCDFYDLDLSDYDLVISTKGPSYMVRHKNHVCYLTHRMRVFYDLYNSNDPENEKRRNLIHKLDEWALKENINVLYTIGHTVSKRLKKWGNIESQVIWLPSNIESTMFHCEEYDYFLVVSRLHELKRIDLAINAVKQSDDSTIKLKIVGVGPDEERLKKLAGNDTRIEFLGAVDDRQLLKLYARAIALIFTPFNEDFGLVTIEAMHSNKPVITVEDSGEPAILVKHAENGFICESSPTKLAYYLEKLNLNKDLARKMGEKAKDSVKDFDWDNVVNNLLDGERLGIREKIFVTDNQIIDPPIGGGRMRLFGLLSGLSKNNDVQYLGAYDWPGPTFRVQKINDNFEEVVIPLTQVHFKLNSIIQKLTGGLTTIDSSMPWLIKYSPKYERLLKRYIESTRVVIVEHPWMFPIVEKTINNMRLEKRPLLIYDSQNCEYLLKKQLFNHSIFGKIILNLVKKTEKKAVEKSDLVFVCSQDDFSNFTRLYEISEDKIHLIPNGVMVNDNQPDAEDKLKAKNKLGYINSKVALFIGSDYPPNIDAVEFIVEKLSPETQEILYIIVGGAGEKYQESSKPIPDNVKILGIVDDELRNSLLLAADIAINPMFRGSGTNIKMFDYMAAGLPVITTEVGARGIDGENELNYIITTSENMKSKIMDLFNNPDLKQSIGNHGYKLVKEKYEWNAIAAKMDKIIKQVLKEKFK